MSMVVDASVVIAWITPDEEDDFANRAMALAAAQPPSVPPLWHYEIFNILRILERKKRISSVDADEMGRDISDLQVLVDQTPVQFVAPRLLDLARIHGLTVYDAAYLELTLRTGLPLATLDKELIIAAQHHKLLLQV